MLIPLLVFVQVFALYPLLADFDTVIGSRDGRCDADRGRWAGCIEWRFCHDTVQETLEHGSVADSCASKHKLASHMQHVASNPPHLRSHSPGLQDTDSIRPITVLQMLVKVRASTQTSHQNDPLHMVSSEISQYVH